MAAPPAQHLLFLHGWGAHPSLYAPALNRLSPDFTVHAPVLPGHGDVPPPPRHTDPLRHLTTYARDHLTTAIPAGEPVTVVGHSLGAVIGTQLTRAHTTRVNHLILICPAGGDPDTSLTGWLRLLRGALSEARDATTPRHRDLRAHLAVAGHITRNPIAAARTGIATKASTLAGPIISVAAHGIPVTVITADRDGITPPLPRIPGIARISVEGQHSWPVHEPEAFAHLVRLILAGDGPAHATASATPASLAPTPASPA